MDSESLVGNLIRVGVLAIGDSSTMLEDVGQSAWNKSKGVLVEKALPSHRYTLLRMLTLPHGLREETARVLRDWCDVPNPAYRCHLILTIGGEGFAVRDIVPEATRDVVEREAPGMAEEIRRIAIDLCEPHERQECRATTAGSRGICGTFGTTLIINIPGCFEDLGEYVTAILGLVHPALDELSRGEG